MESFTLPSCWWKTSTLSCSPEQLTEIITAPNGGYYALPSEPYNEVYNKIYISDGATALSIPLLQSLGVTHVVNAACGKDISLNLINTSHEFYSNYGIGFLGIESLDLSTFVIFPYFEKTANFIHKAINNGGNVLVHCREGISRSATLVIAYLMIKENFTAQEAVRTVRQHREIIPNCGFLKQICELNEILIQKRQQNNETDDSGTKNFLLQDTTVC